MSKLGIKIYTFFNGIKVGEDQFGNQYFQNKKADRTFNRRNRWVIYKGISEASKVPGEWFNWLHYQTDDLPRKEYHKKYDWEKSHIPNTTGTKNAYFPKGTGTMGIKRAQAIGDYQAWKPK